MFHLRFIDVAFGVKYTILHFLLITFRVMPIFRCIPKTVRVMVLIVIYCMLFKVYKMMEGQVGLHFGLISHSNFTRWPWLCCKINSFLRAHLCLIIEMATCPRHQLSHYHNRNRTGHKLHKYLKSYTIMIIWSKTVIYLAQKNVIAAILSSN